MKTYGINCIRLLFALVMCTCLVIAQSAVFASAAFADDLGTEGTETIETAETDETNGSEADSESDIQQDSDGTADSTDDADDEKAKKKSKKKIGNLDKYIGLKKRMWVLATSKKTTKIFTKRSVSSKVKAKLKRNNSIVVITDNLKKGKTYKWVKVDLEPGSGWLRVKKVKFAVLDTKTFGLDTSVKKNKTRIKICRYGLPYLGTEFEMGGMSLKYGIDCSGFARKAMWHAGVSVGSWPLAADLARKGKAVKRKNLKPGDMVFYHTKSSKRISHCAIYLGKGFIINASGHQGHYYPLGGMRITKIDYRRPTASVFRNLVGN